MPRRSPRPHEMSALRRHPLILAILLGALAATGFAPLGLWPLSLLALAGL